MYKNDIRERQCRDFIQETNRVPILDDEYDLIAVSDALSEAYGLDRYPTPPKRKYRARAATAARLGGVFASMGGSLQPCRG